MANNVVGQVSVVVVPDGSQFGPNLQALLNKASGSAQLNLGGSMQSVQQLGQSIDQNVTQRFAQAAIQATAFTGAVYGTKAIIEGVIGKFASLFDQLAQAQAGFTSIIGEKGGSALLGEIRQFAKESPFVTQQLVNYSQQLLGVGMEAKKIVPLLKDTGNVIASVGGDTQNLSRVLFTMTQIQTVGRLTGQDAMQLQSALIPITKMLSSYLGKSTVEIKKMQEQGRISAETVFAAIQAAGQKVPGAMDSAVRNIAGARSVLSDTITIMIQDAPALNAIYQDIVKGIQVVAAQLGEPEVQEAFARFFESVGTAYEAIKPALQEFISTMGSTGLSSVKMFSVVLGTVADVLQVMEPLMPVAAKFLAAIAAIKAPMMLIKYVQQFQTMAGIFKSGTGGLLSGMMGVTNATQKQIQMSTAATAADYARTVQLQQMGKAATLTSAQLQTLYSTAQRQGLMPAPQQGPQGFMSKGFSKIKANAGAIGTTGAMVIGSALSQSENVGAQVAGGALQYGAMGMAMAGPIGAVGGAVVGGLLAYMNAAEEAARKHKQAMMDMGSKLALDFMKSVDASFGTGISAARSTAVRGELESTKVELAAVEARSPKEYRAAAEEYFRMNPEMKTWSEEDERTGARETGIINKTEELKEDERNKLKAKATELQAQYDEQFGDLERRLGLVASNIPTEAGLTNQLYDYSAQGRVLKPLEQFEPLLKRFGIGLEEAANMSETEITRIITGFLKLTTAQQEAVAAASDFNAAYEKGKSAAEGIYGTLSKQISYTLQTRSAQEKALASVTQAYEKQGDTVAQLESQQSVLNAKAAVYAQVYAEKSALHRKTMSDIAADLLAAKEAGLAAENMGKRFEVVARKTVDEMGRTYGWSRDQLKEILGLTEDISGNYKVTITVEIDEAAKKLQLFQDSLVQLNLLPSTTPELALYKAAAQYQIDTQTKIIREAYALQKGGGGGGGGGGGQSFQDKVKSAASSLEGAIKSAMDSAKEAASAWKSTLKDRIQYEQAVSPTAILANARRQMTDITFLQTGIATLKSRGLTEAALSALEINGLTDVRQVKKLLASDPTQLKAISEAVASRDKAASTISADRMQEQSRKTITQAIIEAAKLLGYTPTAEQASQIAATFNITPDTNVGVLVDDLLRSISGGRLAA